VALMVNGLGGTPISELYLLYGYAHELLAQRGINVRRNYVGNYCTSLDMAGTSITLSRLDPRSRDCSPRPRRSRSGPSDRAARAAVPSTTGEGTAVRVAATEDRASKIHGA
jgi:hypothetical protein